MTLKKKFLTITDDGRDKGKVFVITEMPVSRAEKWAFRAVFAMGKSNADFDLDPRGGMAQLVVLGIKSFLSMDFEDAEPLMDEMFSCVMIQPDQTRPDVTRPLVESDIWEISTRLKLRMEVIGLHVNFSIADFLSKLTSAPVPQG